MSAYGAISAPAGNVELPVLSFPLPNDEQIVTYSVTAETAPQELISYLGAVFNEELAAGKTYPQSGPLTAEQFASYYFAAVVIIGVVVPKSIDATTLKTLEEARAGRSWEEAVGGCYYIKPNYPGRSSHNCNAGFLVPPSQRGKKVGGALADSYVIYAPKLGYRGSVFNLVYSNNVASLRLWDKLGFTRVGVIPNAGLLRTGPNDTEEYVDAVVIYKSFV